MSPYRPAPRAPSLHWPRGLEQTLGALVVGSVIAAVIVLTGCVDAALQADVAAYQGDQLLCVQNASSRDAADACRAQVKAYWCGDGGPLSAAGACHVP